MSYKCPNCDSRKTHYIARSIERHTGREDHHYRCKDCWCTFTILKDGTKLVTSYSIDHRAKDTLLAENVLRSVKWHKANCHDPDCNVSTFLLRAVYETLIGRKLTDEEVEVFW